MGSAWQFSIFLHALVLSCINKRKYSKCWKGGASAPPLETTRTNGPLGPETTLLQGLKPPQRGLLFGGAEAPPFHRSANKQAYLCKLALGREKQLR